MALQRLLHLIHLHDLAHTGAPIEFVRTSGVVRVNIENDVGHVASIIRAESGKEQLQSDAALAPGTQHGHLVDETQVNIRVSATDDDANDLVTCDGNKEMKFNSFWRYILQASVLLRRGLLLEYTTLGWNVVGVVIVIIAAIAARSVALAGFGLDSLIEIFASVVVIWQLTGINLHRERLALRLIGVAFILLIIYIAGQLIFTLAAGIHPATSIEGIVWLAATLIAMLLLAWGKRATGAQMKNEVLLTEGKVTLVDAYLAGAVLIGLILNALFGWWWADPLASLVIIYYGAREGIHALREASKSLANE